MKAFTFIASIICWMLSITCVVLSIVFSIQGSEAITVATMVINSVALLITGGTFFICYLSERSPY